MKEEEKFLNWLKDNVNELDWVISTFGNSRAFNAEYKVDNIFMLITVNNCMVTCAIGDEAKILYAREYPVISEIADEIWDRINDQNTNKFWRKINECLNNKD